MDMLDWPVDGGESYEHHTTRFLSALTGGFLLGWGVMIWSLSGAAYDAAPEAVRRSLLIGALSWFVLDSSGSYASGNWPNVIWNILVLLAIMGPLWVPAKGTVQSS